MLSESGGEWTLAFCWLSWGASNGWLPPCPVSLLGVQSPLPTIGWMHNVFFYFLFYLIKFFIKVWYFTMLCQFLKFFVIACFFGFGHTHGIRKLPGQGSKPGHICSLYHSCSNARSITHWAVPGGRTSNATETNGIINP